MKDQLDFIMDKINLYLTNYEIINKKNLKNTLMTIYEIIMNVPEMRKKVNITYIEIFSIHDSKKVSVLASLI